MGTVHLEQAESLRYDPVSAYMQSCEAEASKQASKLARDKATIV